MKPTPTLLLAEDDPLFRIPLYDFLGDKGYSVVLAEHVEDVVQKGTQVDVLILDVMLPYELGSPNLSGGGIIALDRLITEHNLSEDIPVVFISTWAKTDEPCSRMLKEREHIIKKERFEWFEKRFEYEYLSDIISEKIRNKFEFN